MAKDVLTILKEVKADCPQLPVEQRKLLTCKLYNQRFQRSIDTEDIEKAIKTHIEAELKDDLAQLLSL